MAFGLNDLKAIGRRRERDLFFWPGHDRLDYLSNSYESNFEVKGKNFRSVSWYMWYCKAKLWKPDCALAGLIREARTQNQAKRLSSRCSTAGPELRARWIEVRLQLMAGAVLRKFQCSERLKAWLIATGESRLLYACPYDAVFGIGFTMKDGEQQREDEWGQNYLGEMLMLVRRRLIESGNGMQMWSDGVL